MNYPAKLKKITKITLFYFPTLWKRKIIKFLSFSLKAVVANQMGVFLIQMLKNIETIPLTTVSLLEISRACQMLTLNLLHIGLKVLGNIIQQKLLRILQLPMRFLH